MWDLILLPAYGRKYTDAKGVRKDWEGGLDFRILQGPYTSIRDIETLRGEYSTIAIYYGAGDFLEL